MTADGAGELPTTYHESARGDRSTGDDGLSRTLRGGADAVFVVRVGDGGDLVAELANETARLVFGIASDDGAAPALGTSCPASARPILHSLEQAATRSRATRETLMLPAPDGGRIAVDLQLEPLPVQRSGGVRVLAVVRASDPAFEPAVGTGPGAVAVGVLRYERGLGVVFVDAAALALLGLAHERALGQGWLDAVHADDRTRVADSFEAVDDREGVLDLEFRLAADNVRERWARLRAVPESGSENRFAGYLATLEDVTDQLVVTQSSVQLAELADAVEDWVGIVDAHGAFVYANAVARRGLGLPWRDAVAGAPSASLLAFDPHAAGVRMDPDSLHAGIWTGPIRLHGLDGRSIEIAGTIRSHPGPDGTVDQYSFTGRDTADARFAAHEMLRLRRAVEGTTDLITFHARGGRMIFANRAARELIGVAADDPLPRVEMNEFFETTSELAGEMRRAIIDHGRWAGELDVRGRDRRIPASVVVSGHRDASGRYEYFSALSRDISDQRAADAARRRSETALRAIVQSSPLPIFALDGRGTVHVWNRASEELFGWPASDAVGGPPPFVESAEELEVLTALAFSGETVQAHEARYARRDGRPLDVSVSIAPLRNTSGRVVSAVVVVADVSDQRHAELALRDSESTLRASAQRMRVLLAKRKQSEEALRASEARLRESEARYRAIVDDQTELVCRYLPDATLTFTNRAFAEFFGSTSSDLEGAKLVDLRPASERVRTFEWLSSFVSGEPVRTHVEREVSLDGSLRWYQWTDRAFVNAAGDVVEFQSVGHDITDQRRAAEFTVHQAEILEQVARGVPLDETLLTIARALEDQFPRFSCAIMLLDDADDDRGSTTLRVGVAPTLATRMFDSLDGTPVAESSCSCGAAAYLREPVYVHDVMSDERWADHRDIVRAHGLHASWSVPILSSDGNAVLGTLDVFVPEPRLPDDEHRQIFVLLAQLASIAIERKVFEERLAHQSMHDPLTGLPNRLLFLDRLGQAIARCARTRASVGVAFLDLDRFKNVNDSLGHEAGDELLVAVARKLESVIRPGDTVARFGGDEFTVLCEDLPSETARERTVEIAERLLSTVIRPLVVRGTEMFIGGSVGIALATSGEERPEELLRDADAAMYHAKEAGRGRVEVFEDTMRARALSAHSTENALHRALERGEFRIFFQPIVALSDARCVGAEALLRWQHPERGLLPPNEFVPLAEETGLVVQIGRWVLEEAARNAARWQLEQTEPFQVSVNLSARQLAQPDLVDRVAEVIAETGVRPSSLCFEITESVLMDDAESVLDLITRVRSLGVQFAIDDFGTGYSSLGYLKRFPVDSVKIDRSFVSGLGSDAGDAAIVSAVIGLAHALGLRVTAEGVETEEQLMALIALECDEAQGYFFSPPQPAPDLRGLIAGTRTWRPPGAGVMRPADGLRRKSVDET